MPEDIIQIFKADITDLQKKGKEAADRLEKLEKQGKNTGKGISSGFDKAGKSVLAFGSKLLGAFAIIQVVSNAIKIISAFEAQMDKVGSITGATAVEMAKLSASAKQLGATTAFTATEVGQLQEEFAKLGFSTKEILDATKATLDLAAATKSDLATAASVAGATVRGFSLDASETERVVDVMAQAFRSSALDLTKFQVAMASVAPVAADAGVSLEETTALLGLLADRGLDASTAGTSLRNIFLTLSERGLTFNEAMTQINTSTDKSGKALELFGKRGAVAGSIIAQNADQVAALTEKLEDAQGVAQEMATQQLDNLSGKVTILGSAWEGFVLSLEDGNGELGEFLKGAVDAATSILGLLTATEKQSDAIRDQQVALNVLVGRITDVNIAEEDRKILIGELNEEFGELIGNIDAETVSNTELIEKLKEVNEQLINRIIISKEQEKIDEIATDTAEARIEREEAEIELREAIFLSAERQNKESQIENKTLAEQVKILDGARASRSKLGGLLGKFNTLTRDVTESEEELNDVTSKRDELLTSLGIITEEVTDQTEADAQAVKDLNEQEVILFNTIKGLRQEQSKLKDEQVELEIGSARFKEVTIELKRVTDELALAQGKETEAMKEARKEREKIAAEEKKAAKDRLDDIKEQAFEELEVQEAILIRAKSRVDQEDILFKDAQKEAGIRGIERKDLTEQQFAVLQQLEKEHQKRLTDIEKDETQKRTELRDETFENEKLIQQERIEAIQDFGSFLSIIGENQKNAQIEELQTSIDLAKERGEDTEDREKQLEALQEKQNSIAKAGLLLEKGAAIAQVVIQAQLQTATIAATFAALPLVAAPLIVAAKIQAAIRIATIAATAIPAFHEGEVDINPANTNKAGEFDAKLIKGESVIKAEGTSRYHEELQAANNLTLDKLIEAKYVVPAIRKAVSEIENAQSTNLGANIANSLNLIASMDPNSLRKMGKNNKSISQDNAVAIVKGVAIANEKLARSIELSRKRQF